MCFCHQSQQEDDAFMRQHYQIIHDAPVMLGSYLVTLLLRCYIGLITYYGSSRGNWKDSRLSLQMFQREDSLANALFESSQFSQTLIRRYRDLYGVWISDVKALVFYKENGSQTLFSLFLEEVLFMD